MMTGNEPNDDQSNLSDNDYRSRDLGEAERGHGQNEYSRILADRHSFANTNGQTFANRRIPNNECVIPM